MGRVRRAGDGDDAALQVPAQDDLIGGFLVGLCDVLDDLVLREGLDARAATAQWEPCFEDGSEFGHVGLHDAALVVGVRLVLEHGGTDRRNLHHAINVVLVEVRQADAVYLACLHATLHSLIGLFVVGRRVVEQQQVDIVQAEALQPLVHLVVGIVERRCPEFGGDEDVLAADAEVLHGATDAAAHAHLVAVDVGSVDEPHAHFQGVIDRLFRLGGGEQIGADADDGHVVAAIQADGLGLEVKRVCHTECDAVDVADGNLLHGAVGLVNLGLLALHVQAGRQQQDEGY